MNGRIIPVRELESRDETAWRALAARAIDPNPLFEPDCLIPAARHQQFGNEIGVAVAEEGGQFFACIPVREVSRWRKFPYPFVTSQVRRMGYCGTPLVDPERSGEAMAAVFSGLQDRRGTQNGRILVLQELAEGGPVDRAVQEASRLAKLPLYRHESWERPIVLRREEADYRSIHGGKFLRNLGRLRRHLGKELGGEVTMVDRSNDPAAVEELIRLEGAGYKSHSGVAMVTVQGEPEYFTEMCDRFRAAGRLHLRSLEVDGKVCAMQLNVQAREGLFLLKLVYDENLARFRPGLQLHLDVIDDFHENTDAAWLDTCTYANNETLLRMYPDRKRYSSYFVPLGRNPVDSLAARSFITIRPLHKRVVEAREARRANAGQPAAAGAKEPADASVQ